MNTKLADLYSSNRENLCSALKPILEDHKLEVKPTNPLLLKVNDIDAFNKADIRLMIYGQETNSWGEQFSSSIDSTLSIYDEFFNTDRCFSYGGQFWNGVNRFLSLLQTKYPDKKIRFLWNNVVKIGKFADKGFPPDYIYEAERKYFPVIKDEMQIIKPNLVLFFTGPNYDSVIQDNFGKLKYDAVDPFTEREVSKITLDNIPFVFRTYHPNYLWRNDIDTYFDSIIKHIVM